MGGLGKTQLALFAAEQLAPVYPDGQLLIVLRGADAPISPVQALQTVLRTYEPLARMPDDLMQLQARYRAALAGRRVLLLADDAWDAAQVRPLLPPSGCALLITTRQRFTLPGMVALDLDLLAPSAAIDLLLTICPRIGDAAARLAGLCGYLPLALRVSASVLANDDTRSIAHYLDAISDEQARLTHLHDPDDPALDVEATLELSYAALPLEAQLALAHLSIFSATFDQAAARIVADLKSGEALLGLLRRRNLLQWDADTERFSLHDLVRAFAAARRGDATPARLRFVRYYLQIMQEVDHLYRQGGTKAVAALALLDQERAHIDASLSWLQKHGEPPDSERDALLLDYTLALEYISDLRYDVRSERIPLLEAALAAACRLGQDDRKAIVLSNLGNASRDIGALHQAIDQYEQSLVITRRLGDRRGEGYLLGNLGRIFYSLGDYVQACDLYRQRLEIARALGDQRSEGNTLGGLGRAYADLGEVPRAITLYEEQLRIARTIGDPRGEGHALGNLGLAYAALGEPQRAITYHEARVAIARAIGDRRAMSAALGSLGRAYAVLGQLTEAVGLYEQALVIAREIEDRRIEVLTSWNLGEALVQQGDLVQAIKYMQMRVDFERAIGHREVTQHAVRLDELRRLRATEHPQGV